MSVQAFTVLTEFRFDVGSALLNTEQLQGAVQGVSQAADNALLSFQKMSLGMVAQFLTGPGGGILGLLGSAVSAQDEFTKSQIQLANALGSGAGSFSERMAIAEQKMMHINDLAKQFSIPGKELVQMTKILTPIMSAHMPGVKAADKATDLGRQFLKAAPTLGIDPGDALGQLQRAMLGMADAGDPMFRTLTADTNAMREFAGQTKKFNALPLDKRVQKLSDAFAQFSSNTDALHAVVNSVSGQMSILKQNLTGMFSVLRPLGQTIIPLVIEALKRLNEIVDKNLRVIIEHISRALKPFVGDLDRFLATVLQLRGLKGNLDFAKEVFHLSALFMLLQGAMHFFGISLTGVWGVLARIAPIFTMLGALLSRLVIFLWPFIVALGALLIQMSLLAGLIIFISQIFERASAIIKIRFADTFIMFATKLADIGETFMRIMGVFDDGIQTLAELLAYSPVIDFVIAALNGAIDLLGWMVTKLGQVLMGFQGIFFAIMEFLNQITSFLGGKGFDGGKIGTAMDAGMEDMFNKIFARPDKAGPAIGQSVTNIGKVEIRNDFKEKIEPDRVAFTLKKQLMDVAQNRTKATGISQPASQRGGR